jgi:hypothetical protein
MTQFEIRSINIDRGNRRIELYQHCTICTYVYIESRLGTPPLQSIDSSMPAVWPISNFILPYVKPILIALLGAFPWQFRLSFLFPQSNTQLIHPNLVTLLRKAWGMVRHVGRAIAQVVSRRLPTAAARVQTQVWSCGILWWTKVALGQVFCRELRFPLPIYIPSASPQSSFTITRGWHNRPGVATVPIASQTN